MIVFSIPKADKRSGDVEADEIVATNLALCAMPMIRYRTDNVVEGCNEEPC